MTSHSITTALILAAGQGSRFGTLGKVMPKALAPVLNQPLLVRQIKLLASGGVKDVHIVIGHLGHLIKAAIEANPIPDVSIHFHEQKERLGLAHAVAQAETALGENPFVLILADIAYEAKAISDLLTLPNDVDAVVAVKDEPDIDAIRRNFSVELNKDGLVRRLIEKPVDPPNSMKGTGQYVFSPAIFEAIRNTPRSELRNEYELTDAIQTLVDMGKHVAVSDTITWDLNLTFPADLLACNLYMLAQDGVDHVSVSDVPDGSVVRYSVLGSDVRFDGPVSLNRCVVLDGAVLPSGAQLEGAVIAANGQWTEDT